MDLIDEEDDVALRVGHLLDDGLQPLLKLTFIFGTSQESTHIEREELLVFQVLRHVATHDALSQTFHDGRLTRTRLTYQDRIVLGAARENLQHAAYLLVTANHRIEFALAGILYQVAGILGECLVVVVCALALHLLSLAQLSDGFPHHFLRQSSILKDARCRVVALEQGDEHRLDADELITHLGGNVLGLLQHLGGVVAEVGFTSAYFRQVLYFAVHKSLDLLRVDSSLSEDKIADILALIHHTRKQMHRFDGLLSGSLCSINGFLNRFLRFDGKLVECHSLCSFLSDLFLAKDVPINTG